VGVKCSMRGRDEKCMQKTKGNRPLGGNGIVWDVILKGKEKTRIRLRGGKKLDCVCEK